MPNLFKQFVAEQMVRPKQWPIYPKTQGPMLDPYTGDLIGEHMKEYNNPICLRPNDEDRRLLDKLKAYLARLTKQEVFDTAAIRFALRYWDEREK